MNINNIQKASQLLSKLQENERCLYYFVKHLDDTNRAQSDCITEFINGTRNLGTGGQKSEVLQPMIRAAIEHFKVQNEAISAEIKSL